MVMDRKAWSVNLWGSHPEAENDDCWTGDDYATEGEARAVYEAADPVAAMAASLPEPKRPEFIAYHSRDTVFVEIDGPTSNEVRRLRADRRRFDDREWSREIATQAGMMGGCDAYNGAMGW